MCTFFLQISISYKQGVPIRFTKGAPYIFNIDKMVKSVTYIVTFEKEFTK